MAINTKALAINTKQSSVGMNDCDGLLNMFHNAFDLVNSAIKGIHKYIGIIHIIMDVHGTICLL